MGSVRARSPARILEDDTRGSVATGTIGKYLSENDDLGACIVKDEDTGGYEVTPVGEKALAAPWDEIAA